MEKDLIDLGTTEKFKMPTANEIEDLKKTHGELHLITVNDKIAGERYAIVRKPKMNDMQIAAASEKRKVMTYNQSLYNNCKVVADPEIENNDALLLAVYEQINDLIEVATGSIKKL